MLSCLHLVDLKTRRGHKKFQKSYASNLNKRPNWCHLLCLHFSGMRESSTHSCHRPQNTAIACPLVTNGKTNRCLLGTLHPAKGEQWFYCYSQKKNAGIRAKPLSATSSEAMTPLMHWNEEYLKILIIFQGVFSLKCRSG